MNNPLLEMEPAVAAHVTDVLPVLKTRAVNCCDDPEFTVTVVGDTVTEIAPACVVNT